MIMMHLSDKNYCFVNHNLGFNHINDEFLSLNFHIKTHTASGKSFLASNTEGVYCHRHSVNEWDFHPLFINFFYLILPHLSSSFTLACKLPYPRPLCGKHWVCINRYRR